MPAGIERCDDVRGGKPCADDQHAVIPADAGEGSGYSRIGNIAGMAGERAVQRFGWLRARMGGRENHEIRLQRGALVADHMPAAFARFRHGAHAAAAMLDQSAREEGR